jgi:RimJ/RimL family protein N-acetyltransferase
MAQYHFLETERLAFSKWAPGDGELAARLWGDPKVTRYLCASGKFTPEEIEARLATEIENDIKYQVQYWPCFQASTHELVGCCGLRPHGKAEYELGFHLRPEFWGQGYASEAARAVIRYAFTKLSAEALFAGHNPNNAASSKVLKKLGFQYLGDEFYAPTGLYHPSYKLPAPEQ